MFFSVNTHVTRPNERHGINIALEVSSPPLVEAGKLHLVPSKLSPTLKFGTCKKKPLSSSVNYLALRRNQPSHAAALRNQQIQRAGQEIISSSPPTRSSRRASFHDRIQALAESTAHADMISTQMLNEPEALRLPTEEATCTMIKLHAESLDVSREFDDKLRQFELQQERLEQEKLQQQRRVDELIVSIRTNCLASIYRFTPLFKLFVRIQLQAAMGKWKQYIWWHRVEMQRLEALQAYAIPIQRLFRKRRQRRKAEHMHILTLVQQWRSVVFIVTWNKRVIARTRNRVTRRHQAAVRIQAVARGRFARKRFKGVLREVLRSLLREVSPTGDLFRLQEVALLHHELANWLSRLLSLVEETHVHIQQRTALRAFHAAVAAQAAGTHLEVSNRQLLDGILETKDILKRRQHAVINNKQAFSEQKQKQLTLKASAQESEKLMQLHQTFARLQEQQEAKQMFDEELAMRDFVRMELTKESDAVLRAQIRQQRNEQEANERMVVEEYQMRYYVKFSVLYRQEQEKAIREVEKKRRFENEVQQAKLHEHLLVLEEFETKQMEVHHRKQLQREQEQLKWAKETEIQLELAAKRFEQRQMLEHLRSRQDHMRELERERQRLLSRMEREANRVIHQRELECEAQERSAMEQEEKLVLALHFARKKREEMALWEARRAEVMREFYLDPMNFDKLRAKKQQEEKMRRERYVMHLEETAMRKIMEHEAKLRRLEAARARERVRQKELRIAKREIPFMAKEDKAAMSQREADTKAKQYRQTLAKMQAIAIKDAKRRDEVLSEARNRKQMREEELRQRRCIQQMTVKQTRSEKYEVQLMQKNEQEQREVEAFLAKRERKRLREHNMLQMLKEDARSLCREEWEVEGAQLEKLLWSDPSDRLAFSHVVQFHWEMLRLNVLLFRKVGCVEAMPPFELDYDAVHNHLQQEATMTLEQVPPPKHKPRKFFFHEFFEEDPLQFLLQKREVKDSQQQPVKPSRARQRWQRLSEHFLGSHWSKLASERGFELMKEESYEKALTEMMRALTCWENQPRIHKHNVPVALLHQLGRCYFALWRRHLVRSYLQKSVFYFSCASQDLMLLCNATFLFELARTLEDHGELKSAARILGNLIECFPKFAQLNLVIFRAGVIMMALSMLKQSREYLIHTMDTKPFGFEPFEIVFVVARVLQLEKQTKMASIAYEEAFRKNSLQDRRKTFEKYETWQQWINDCQTWRVFGDRFFEQQEYLLAKDAYQLVIKRRSLRDARVAGSDHDWLRLARVHAVLNDRASVQKALVKWVKTRNYVARIEEKYNNWSPVRWKLLGIRVPPAIEVAFDARMKQQLEEEENKAKRRAARAHHSIVLPKSPEADIPAASVVSQEELNSWKEVRDEESGELYFWNELTDEVSWDIPY